MAQEIVAGAAQLQTPSASFTRPSDTTPYASGDLVANSVTAGSVVAMQFPVSLEGGIGKVRRARISKSTVSPTNAQFRLHLYSANPTAANGDNAAWSTDQALTYLGSLSMAAVAKAFTDGCRDAASPDVGSEINFNIPTGIIYGLLEARAAYTPVSAEVFTVALEIAEI